MIVEFAFTVPDEPGQLSKVTSALGNAGVNIEGFAEVSIGAPQAAFRLVVDDEKKAKAALDDAGIAFTTHDAFELSLPNSPGALAKLSTKLAEEGINITSFYVTMQGKQILSVDNQEGAEAMIDEFQ